MSVRECCVSVIGLCYTLHVTAFSLGGPFFSGHRVDSIDPPSPKNLPQNQARS